MQPRFCLYNPYYFVAQMIIKCNYFQNNVQLRIFR